MASYIGVSPPEQTGIVERYKYTGNGSTTAFSGADTNAKVLRYTSTNPILVFLNGVQLVEGTDFTKTSNTVVTFATAPANSDDIEILTFGSFNLNSPATIRCDLGLNTTDSPTFNGLTTSGLTVDTNTLHVNATNNRVGIGTSSPDEELHIVDNSDPRILLEDSSGDNQVAVRYKSANRCWIAGSSGGNSTFSISYADAFGSNDYFNVHLNGNVGIGTTSPGTSLHVIGGVALGSDTIANHSAGTLTGVTKLVFGGDNDANGVVGGRIYSSGNALHIQGGTSGLNLRGANNNVHLDINCTTGNVGICNNLTVAGNLTINGTTTTLNTATLDIEDKTLCIAKGAANAAAANGAGLIVDGASASLLYNSSGDCFAFNKTISVTDGNEIHGLGNKGCQIFFGQSALLNNNQGLGNIALGYEAMKANVSGCYNTAVGHQALTANVSDAGSYNTAHGFQALYSNTTGEKNTAIGYHSMYSNTTGEYNAAIGTDSLRANTTGEQNVALGHNSLYNNTFGNGQVAAGYKSLFNNTTGNYNVGLGAYNLEFNTAGSCNVGIGYQSLNKNTTGSFNVAVGYGSLYANTTGQYNNALGYRALYANTTGEHNIGIGHEVLYTNTVGVRNVAIGRRTLYSNTTGSYNVSLGQESMYDNTTGANNVAVGYEALRSNTIGQYNNALGYRALYASTTANYNSSIGFETLFSNTTGNNNIALGFRALKCNTTGGENVALGSCTLFANVSATDNVAIGNQALKSLTGTNTGSNVAVGACAMQNAQGQNNTVVGRCAMANATSSYNVVMGRQSLAASGTVGGFNTALGFQSLCKNTAGSNTAVGSYSGFNNTSGEILAIGYSALCSNTTGDKNTAVGRFAMKCNTTGNDNTAVGHFSLCKNTTGVSNVAVGSNSMLSNVTGQLNIAVGAYSLKSNTNGCSQIAIGSNSLCTNTTGVNNVAIGHNSLRCNVSGINNVGIGYMALCCTKGNSNVGIGHQVLQANTTGIDNVAIGCQSLFKSTTAQQNVAIGTMAGACITTGCDNVAIGSRALCAGTTGTENVAVGRSALRSTTTGSYNVAIGSNALTANITGRFNVAIGREALCKNTNATSNTAVGNASLRTNTVGSSNTAIGVNSMYSNTTGYSNTALGASSLNLNTTGIFNVAVGVSALCGNTTGVHNTAVGACALKVNATGHSNTAVGFRALEDNISGHSNTAVGFCAMCNNTTGISNTAVGVRAGMLNAYGIKNTSVGESALQNSTVGVHNVAMGYQALGSNAGGNHNTALGTCALYTSLNYYNTAVGSNAGKLQGTQAAKYNIYLGYNAGCNLTTGAGNVMIGTVQPESNTGNRQLKIAGYDGTATTTWITGDLSGNIGIGTDTPTGGTARTLQISHDGSARLLLENTGGGRKYGFFAGTDGKLGLFDYTGATQRLAVDTSGNFGIGTTSPSQPLTVSTSSTNVPLKLITTGSQTYSGIMFESTQSDDYVGIGVDVENLKLRTDDGHITFHVAENTEKVRISSAGNVGIGLTNPDSFHVSGRDLVVGNTTGGHGLTIVASTNDAGSINFGDATNASFRGKITYEHSNDSLAFHAGAAEKFRVGSNGNFSIGTTADPAKLNVRTASSGVTPNANADELFVEGSGNSGITIGSGTSGAGQIAFGDSGDNDIGALAYLHDVNAMRFTTSGQEAMRITSAGDLLVGTTSTNPGIGNANTGFSVVKAGGQVGHIAISQNGNYSANFNRNTSDGTVVQISKQGTVKHVITTTGIGIGNGNPQNKLDISALTWDDGITIKNTGNFNVGIIGDANRSSAGGGLLNLQGRWNGTEVASILFQAGSDTTNKDNGEIVFRTAPAGTPQERVKITSAGNVGIGLTNPTNKLHIFTTATEQGISIDNTANVGALRSLNMYIDGSGKAVIQKNSAAGAEQSLLLNPNSGNVGIGTTSPSQRLDVLGSAQISFSSGVNTYQYFQSTSNFIGRKTDGNLNIGVAGSQDIVSSVGGTEITRVTSVGKVQFKRARSNTLGRSSISIEPSDTVVGYGFRMEQTNNDLVVEKSAPSGSEAELLRFKASGGIALGGTGTANTLDDYEEGNWTPGLTIGSSGNSGTYTKIGNLVTVRFRVLPTASGSNVRITGLPFASTGATTGEQQGGSRETETSGKFFFIRVSNNSTEASIIRYDANVSVTASMTFEGNITYLTT